MMRDKMERFVLLPFSIGCVSESSIAVAVHHPQPRRSSPKPPPTSLSLSLSLAPSFIFTYTTLLPIFTYFCVGNGEDDEESLSSHDAESMKNSLRLHAIPKPDISNGFNRLFKGFKNFSQLFDRDEDIEEMEGEMEIGFPTDVKHVTHIGLDGSTTNNNNNNNPIKGWDSFISPDDHQPFTRSTSLPPSVSMDQFQIAMAAQAQAHHPHHHLPLVNTTAAAATTAAST
ncbi:hypothetical protein JRO89_XS04G0028700 [Xanthoceras sorbifolium]|uniref:CRIB domain-containing protein n=1 Tax=Xanthoceras sorbifolium TaxID=99658 RepID=A0ABQ8I4A1_9ROSI|nr:hypothetical protein JRO89_XS04G0028700 [Xanthoceras sorbifolium]